MAQENGSVIILHLDEFRIEEIYRHPCNLTRAFSISLIHDESSLTKIGSSIKPLVVDDDSSCLDTPVNNTCHTESLEKVTSTTDRRTKESCEADSLVHNRLARLSICDVEKKILYLTVPDFASPFSPQYTPTNNINDFGLKDESSKTSLSRDSANTESKPENKCSQVEEQSHTGLGRDHSLNVSNKTLNLIQPTIKFENLGIENVAIIEKIATCSCFDQDGTLYVGDRSGDLHRINTKGEQSVIAGCVSTITDVHCMSFHDKKLVVFGDRDEKIRFIRQSHPHVIDGFLLSHKSYVAAIAEMFFPDHQNIDLDSKLMISVGGDNRILSWRIHSKMNTSDTPLCDLPIDMEVSELDPIDVACEENRVAIVVRGSNKIYRFICSPDGKISRLDCLTPPLGSRSITSLLYCGVSLIAADCTTMYIFPDQMNENKEVTSIPLPYQGEGAHKESILHYTQSLRKRLCLIPDDSEIDDE